MKTSYTAQLNDVIADLPPLPWDAVCVCEDVIVETMPVSPHERPITIARFEDDDDEAPGPKARAAYVSHCCNYLPMLVESCRDALALLVNGESGSELLTKNVITDLRAALDRVETVNLIQMEYM